MSASARTVRCITSLPGIEPARQVTDGARARSYVSSRQSAQTLLRLREKPQLSDDLLVSALQGGGFLEIFFSSFFTAPCRGYFDGDYQMIWYATAGNGKRLGMFVHHDDADREYAYNRGTHFGKLDKGLDDAFKQGRHIISMKDDWKQIFPAQ